MRKYRTRPFHALGGVYVSFSCGFFFPFFYTRLCRRALLRTPAQAGRRRGAAELNSDNGATEGGQVLAEVVVCAVGLSYYPLVEMTAQSTALLALATDGAGTKPNCAL